MTSLIANPTVWLTQFGLQVPKADPTKTDFHPLAIFDDQAAGFRPLVTIFNSGVFCVHGGVQENDKAMNIFGKALSGLHCLVTIQASDGKVLGQIGPDLYCILNKTTLSFQAIAFIEGACYEAEQMRKNVPTPVPKQAPKCECGGRSMGARDYQPGHSDWCDVSHTKGK